MVDSTNIADEPVADLVAYYCDGAFAVSEAAVRARFPRAVLVPISAVGTNAGVVGDCEPGCMTEDELVTWVLERRAAGIDPTGYVNEMHGWVPAKAAFARRGVPEPHWWVADYDAVDVIPPGAVAKQDMNSAMTGGHFDRSVVADFWPGVDSVFGPGGGSLGDDMTPEEHAWIRVAARGQLPPRPASLGDEFESTGGHTDGAFLEIYAHSSQSAFIAAYGQDGYAYISALYHGSPRSASTAASVDLSPVLAGQSVINAKVDVVAGTVQKIESALKGA